MSDSVPANKWSFKGRSATGNTLSSSGTAYYDFTSAANSAMLEVNCERAVVHFNDDVDATGLSGNAIQLRLSSIGTDGTDSEAESIAPPELALAHGDTVEIPRGFYYVHVTSYSSGTGRVTVTGGV